MKLLRRILDKILGPRSEPWHGYPVMEITPPERKVEPPLTENRQIRRDDEY